MLMKGQFSVVVCGHISKQNRMVVHLEPHSHKCHELCLGFWEIQNESPSWARFSERVSTTSPTEIPEQCSHNRQSFSGIWDIEKREDEASKWHTVDVNARLFLYKYKERLCLPLILEWTSQISVFTLPKNPRNRVLSTNSSQETYSKWGNMVQVWAYLPQLN